MSTQELGHDPGNEVGRRADRGLDLALILAVLFAVSLIATAGPGESGSALRRPRRSRWATSSPVDRAP